MSILLAYVTTSGPEEAERIGSALVEERLAACVNIIPGMTSLYWWEGGVQRDTECILVAKTTAEKFDSLTARVVGMHSYDCACVIGLPVDGGNAAFLDWIVTETSR